MSEMFKMLVVALFTVAENFICRQNQAYMATMKLTDLKLVFSLSFASFGACIPATKQYKGATNNCPPSGSFCLYPPT